MVRREDYLGSDTWFCFACLSQGEQNKVVNSRCFLLFVHGLWVTSVTKRIAFQEFMQSKLLVSTARRVLKTSLLDMPIYLHLDFVGMLQ